MRNLSRRWASDFMKGCGLKNAHPAVSFLYFAFVFVLSFSVSHPLPAAVSFASALAYDVYLRRKRALKTVLLFLLPVILLLPLVNGLFNHYGVTVLFTLRDGNGFTLEAMVYGLFTAVKFASVLLWLDCFNEIIDSDKFIFIFGRFSPRIALVISMTLRFIPLLRDGYAQIEQARKGIGFSSADKSLLRRMKNSVHTLSILITWVLESAIDTSYSMKARGYGLKGRTSYNPYIFTGTDAFTVAAAVLLSGFACLSVFGLKALYNPVIEIDRPDVLQIFSLLFFLMLCVLPFAADIRERRILNPKERKSLVV